MSINTKDKIENNISLDIISHNHSILNQMNKIITENNIKFLSFLYYNHKGFLKNITIKTQLLDELSKSNFLFHIDQEQFLNLGFLINTENKKFKNHNVQELYLLPDFSNAYINPFSTNSTLNIYSHIVINGYIEKLFPTLLLYKNEFSSEYKKILQDSGEKNIQNKFLECLILDPRSEIIKIEKKYFHKKNNKKSDNAKDSTIQNNKKTLLNYLENKFSCYVSFSIEDKKMIKSETKQKTKEDDNFDIRSDIMKEANNLGVNIRSHYLDEDYNLIFEIDSQNISKIADDIEKLKYTIQNILFSYGYFSEIKYKIKLVNKINNDSKNLINLLDEKKFTNINLPKIYSLEYNTSKNSIYIHFTQNNSNIYLLIAYILLQLEMNEEFNKSSKYRK